MAKASDFDPGLLKLFDGYVHGKISRREFIDRAAAFAVSGAAALAALSPDYSLAQQVAPNDPSITVGYKKYLSRKGGGEIRGYFARPAVIDHRLPGIVVIHENRGLNPYIEDVARRLASAGFIAFAPDALWPLGGYPGNDDDGRAMQRQRDQAAMTEDFVAAVRFLQNHPDTTDAIGAVGFCFGGSMALAMAIRVPELGAAVAFYGRHPAAEEVASIKAPLLLHHGELDERVNAGWPDFEAALKSHGVAYQNHFYPGANHGFHNDTTPRYDKEAAALAWRRTVAHFDRHLATGAD